MDKTFSASEKRTRMIRTFATFLTWICMGLFSEISGPTLPFLRNRVNANYEEISRTLMARSVGFLAGSFIGGALYERWQQLSDIWLAMACVFGGIGTIFAPFTNQLAVLGVLFCLDGVGKGVMALGANHLLMILWGQKAAVPNQALHFSFGIGAFIAPQLAMPFLPEDDHGQYNITQLSISNHTSEEDTPNQATRPAAHPLTTSEPVFLNMSSKIIENSIQWPYLIIGTFTLMVAVINVVLYLVLPSVESHKEKSETKSKCCVKHSDNIGRRLLGMIITLLLLLYWTLPVGAERAYGKFLFAFSTDSGLGFTNKKASILVLVFWAAFTLGRLIATGLAVFLGTSSLMILELSVNAVSAIVLYCYAHNNAMVMWTCTVFFAASLSPLFPGAIAWANCHMKLTPLKTALAFVSASAGAFIFSWLSGYLFEYQGPRSLMAFMFAYSVVSLVLFVLLMIAARWRKYHNSHTDNTQHTEHEKCKTSEVEHEL